MHSGELNFPCTQCGKKFATAHFLKIHDRYHERMAVKGIQIPHVDSNGGKSKGKGKSKSQAGSSDPGDLNHTSVTSTPEEELMTAMASIEQQGRDLLVSANINSVRGKGKKNSDAAGTNISDSAGSSGHVPDPANFPYLASSHYAMSANANSSMLSVNNVNAMGFGTYNVNQMSAQENNVFGSDNHFWMNR